MPMIRSSKVEDNNRLMKGRVVDYRIRSSSPLSRAAAALSRVASGGNYGNGGMLRVASSHLPSPVEVILDDSNSVVQLATSSKPSSRASSPTLTIASSSVSASASTLSPRRLFGGKPNNKDTSFGWFSRRRRRRRRVSLGTKSPSPSPPRLSPVQQPSSSSSRLSVPQTQFLRLPAQTSSLPTATTMHNTPYTSVPAVQAPPPAPTSTKQEQQQQNASPQPAPLSPLPIVHVASVTSNRSRALVLGEARVPEFLTVDEILKELPPPNLMDDDDDDASSAPSASSSTLTFSVDHVSLADEGDDEEEEEDLELSMLAAHAKAKSRTAARKTADQTTVNNVDSETGWWERLWEMVDPDERTINTRQSELETVEGDDCDDDDDEEEVAAARSNVVDSVSAASPPVPIQRSPSWWSRSSKSRHSTIEEESLALIRPPSRGVVADDKARFFVLEGVPTIPHDPVRSSSLLTTSTTASNPNKPKTEDKKQPDKQASCCFCSLATEKCLGPLTPSLDNNISATPDKKTAKIEIEPIEQKAANKEDQAHIEPKLNSKDLPSQTTRETSNVDDGNNLETDMIGDSVSVILTKLDQKFLPWLFQTCDPEQASLVEPTSKADPKTRKVRFAADVKECKANYDDDDDGIVEDAARVDSAFLGTPSAVTRFLNWLASLETTGASLSDTNDAICQPIRLSTDRGDKKPGPTYSFVIDPKIPLEINMMTCNFDDSTALTPDPSFFVCGNLMSTKEEEEKPKPIVTFLRRTGRALPVKRPPFLRKAPVNKEREQHELEIARAMWRHYKKTRDMKDNVDGLKWAAERQRQREEWAAAVAAHRNLRQCNHVNCQCHQERW